jgi:hypothetical protein
MRPRMNDAEPTFNQGVLGSIPRGLTKSFAHFHASAGIDSFAGVNRPGFSGGSLR